MTKIYRNAALAAMAGLFALSTTMPAVGEGVDRDFRKYKKRTGYNFNFFGLGGNDRNRNRKRSFDRNLPSKPEKSLFYTYQKDPLVKLGDRSLKQPGNKVVPAFSVETANGKSRAVEGDFGSSSKLDDSLAQTIFDNLKSGTLSVNVTRAQKKAIIAFYKKRNFKSVWTDMDGVTQKARALIGYLGQAEREGLRSTDYLPASMSNFHDDFSNIETSLDEIARLDLELTAMAVRYGQHASGGRVVPNRLSGYHDLNPPRVSSRLILDRLAETGEPQAYLASLHPSNSAYKAFKRALADLDSQKRGKIYARIAPGRVIKPGFSDERVVQIRERLTDLGLLEKPAVVEDGEIAGADFYDKQVVAGLKKFQKSKGLRADGIVGNRTIAAFNRRKNVNKRKKLILNMERLRWLPRKFGRSYVFVNQASFQLQVIKNGSQAWQTRVVVGKPKNQTSFFVDKMETVVFNPYWGVPQSIITKEMLPRLRANPGYLDQRGFEVYNSRGRKVSSSSVDWYNYGGRKVPFSIRQPPSNRNALGRLKFLFPNKHAIYLHDTPSKSLFARSSRAFSHGCVRVQNPITLAENILGWSRSRIDQKLATKKNTKISLKKTIPVYLTYFTAWKKRGGKIGYYSDVYGRDQRLDRALNLISVASSKN